MLTEGILNYSKDQNVNLRKFKIYTHCLAGWQVGRLAGWQVGRLAGWQVGRLAGWQVGRLAGWQVGLSA